MAEKMKAAQRRIVQNVQDPCEDIDCITVNQLRDIMIDQFANLQRIKHASDKDKEIDYQIRVLKEKLKVFDVDVNMLVIS